MGTSRDEHEHSAGHGDELARTLERLAAETRADDAASGRRRRTWLGRPAEEEATLAGVLVDLGERGRPVVVHTMSGRVHRGWLRGVGEDFVALRSANGTDILLHVASITSVRSPRGEPTTVGDRPLDIGASLASTIRALGPERPRVLLASGRQGDVLSGELRWAGADVCAVRLDGDGATAYVPLEAITELRGADPLVP